MSELTNVANQLADANAALATMQTGVTQIGKDTAKLLQQALDAETPAEKAAVAAEFETLKAGLAKMGGDVSAIDALVPDEPAP
jgi:hypothetical protein